MFVLGISAYYHDSAACIIYNDKIIAAAQEERFTRIKQDETFPINAVKYCLEEAGITLDGLDAIVYYEKPFLKFERLLENFHNVAPRGLFPFVKSIPVWIKEKLFIKREIISSLKQIGKFNAKKTGIYFSEHHLSHAASTFFASNFEEAAILTIDGMGEWASASIGIGRNNKVEILKELHYPNSLGLLYSAFTYFLGFVVNSGEYKLMGLAPFGNKDSERTKQYKDFIKNELVEIKDDGSIRLNMKYFGFAYSLKMIKTEKWEKLFGIKLRKPEDILAQEHSDLAIAIQEVTEDIVLKMASYTAKVSGMRKLCLAGGVSLNCVANGRLLRENIFEDIYIQPAAGDAGGAVGAALAFVFQEKSLERKILAIDMMNGSYLGPEFSDKDIIKVCNKYNADYQYYQNEDELLKYTAKNIADSKVVGWFQGRMEFGPRALGNRSILGDARNPEMQKKLNLSIKYREGFRPFAPSVLDEDSPEIFEMTQASPYMLLVTHLKNDLQFDLPDNYESMPVMEKLYVQRSPYPAITHCDYSARIQTVHKETNPKYHNLISEYKKITGKGIIVNTSFNVRGEPIVCSPEDAYRCFIRTEMDVLVMHNFVFLKEKQKAEKNEIRDKFKPD
jgi:carbamoyltransferase